jgi:hypothetical protein
MAILRHNLTQNYVALSKNEPNNQSESSSYKQIDILHALL